EQQGKGQVLRLPRKTDAFLRWSQEIARYTATASFEAASRYWDVWQQQPPLALPRDDAGGSCLLRDMREEKLELSEAESHQLLTTVHTTFGTQINEILLSALVLG
ncbi:condensation domain-containing protein, partial [Chitinophaga varians]|uniref:condensation domain-containing protein n=1 Tax=Chitinophaga varians TaxID=2202339 RepID=UPI00165F9384